MTAPTEESPWNVRDLNKEIADYIGKLGHIWVEGQLAQVKHRPGSAVSFASLRDVEQKKSIELTCSSEVLEGHRAGDKVLIFGRPQFWGSQGTLSLRAKVIKNTGVGDLRADIEKLKRKLYNEGLFDSRRKKSLPKFPKRVGLITGKDSAAERDVIAVATQRWPHVQFDVRHVLVQGKSSALQVSNQVVELDAASDVDLILIARGGGSFEDLLSFSDEDLLRTVSNATTPIVSAIGHEPDTPLLDDVADLRAATPTDAAKRIVPNLWDEVEKIEQYNWTLHRTVESHLANGLEGVEDWGRRLDRVMKDPTTQPRRDVEALERRLFTAVTSRLHYDRQQIVNADRHLDALGPGEVLARGYAIAAKMTLNSGVQPISDVSDLNDGDEIRIELAGGYIHAQILTGGLTKK